MKISSLWTKLYCLESFLENTIPSEAGGDKSQPFCETPIAPKSQVQKVGPFKLETSVKDK